MKTYHGPKAATFAAMDRLPQGLRHEIAFASRVYDATSMEPMFRDAARCHDEGWAVDWLRRSIEAEDERDVRVFGAAYRGRYGVALPHIAAEATILRYEPRRHASRDVSARGCSTVQRRALASCGRLLPKPP